MHGQNHIKFVFLILKRAAVVCTFPMHRGGVHFSYFLLCSVNIT